MAITLENVQKNKELYSNCVEKKMQKSIELIRKLDELKMKIKKDPSAKNIVTCNFEEAKVMQELNSVLSGWREDKLTLMILELQENALQGKIDQITYSDKIGEMNKSKEVLLKEAELLHCEGEVYKCEKALKLFTLLGESKEVEKWQEELKKAQQDLKYVKEDME